MLRIGNYKCQSHNVKNDLALGFSHLDFRCGAAGRGSSETIRRAPSAVACRAYLLGAMHDGTFNKHNRRFRFSQAGTEWLMVLKKCLARIGYNAWMYREGSQRNVYVLETLAGFLDAYFSPVQLKTVGEKKAYLRGFFDAEGGIPKSPTARFYVQLVQNDRNKLNVLKILLGELEIQTGKIHNPSFRVDPDYFRMFVRKDSYARFLTEVGTWHPRKLRTLRRRMKI